MHNKKAEPGHETWWKCYWWSVDNARICLATRTIQGFAKRADIDTSKLMRASKIHPERKFQPSIKSATPTLTLNRLTRHIRFYDPDFFDTHFFYFPKPWRIQVIHCLLHQWICVRKQFSYIWHSCESMWLAAAGTAWRGWWSRWSRSIAFTGFFEWRLLQAVWENRCDFDLGIKNRHMILISGRSFSDIQVFQWTLLQLSSPD